MANVFIGYEIRKGAFTKNGEEITYNNRILRFITDAGSDKTHIGYDSFSAKMSLEAVAASLGCQPSDSLVDAKLNELIQHEVSLSYAPRNGENTLISFTPVKS